MKTHRRLVGTLLLIGVTLVSVYLYDTYINYQSRSTNTVSDLYMLSTPVISPSENRLFLDSFVLDVDINSGITMFRPPFLTVISGPTPSPNFVSFVVLNHTDESIVFPNQGFGLRVFSFDKTMQLWREFTIQKPERTEKVLPPNLERFDFDIYNQWNLHPDNFLSLTVSELRLYVSGFGRKTGTHYGTYLDVMIQP